MDLRETPNLAGPQRRHPWETARLRMILHLLRPELAARPATAPPASILDYGCGDAFVSAAVAVLPRIGRVTALDSNLEATALAGLAARLPAVHFVISDAKLGNERFDIILLLDVLEHVAADADFLRDLAARRLAPGGSMLVTVPAFQALFSAHDTFLGHHRRYSPAALLRTINAAGLGCRRRGGLFFSLLPPRLLQVMVERLAAGRTYQRKPAGIGGWQLGRLLTGILHGLLCADGLAGIWLARCGLRLPGLSCWAVCRQEAHTGSA